MNKPRQSNLYQPPSFDDFPYFQPQTHDRRSPSLVEVPALIVRLKMRILHPILILASISLLIGCSRNDSGTREVADAQQSARIQILNAFSATDSAIQAVAYRSQVIESISDDRGGSSNGGGVDEMRAWSIHLKPGTSVEDRQGLVAFLRKLAAPYDDFDRYRSGASNEFEFGFSVSEVQDRIDVRAEGAYGKP